jgi:hypothetical protein
LNGKDGFKPPCIRRNETIWVHEQGRWRYLRNIGMTPDLAARIEHLQRDGYLDLASVSEGVSLDCKR